MTRRRFFSMCSIAAVLEVTACGKGETRDESFESEVQGAAYAFVLRSDAGVREGPNAFDLEIQPIEGGELGAAASVTVVVRMRAMTHSEQVVDVTRRAGSSFEVGGVIFAMPGTWDLEISVEEGAAVDRATFELDVP